MVSIDSMQLLRAAEEAATRAHAPYSKFKVGAAALAPDGTILAGCNVENVSYGLTNCAERTAIFTGIAGGYRSFQAMAIVCQAEAAVSPCGACRQVLAEFCGPDTPIYIAAAGRLGDYETFRLGDLLPKAFEL